MIWFANTDQSVIEEVYEQMASMLPNKRHCKAEGCDLV